MIRCAGTNDNRIPHNDFHRMFVQECQVLGRITKLADLGSIIIVEVQE